MPRNYDITQKELGTVNGEDNSMDDGRPLSDAVFYISPIDYNGGNGGGLTDACFRLSVSNHKSALYNPRIISQDSHVELDDWLNGETGFIGIASTSYDEPKNMWTIYLEPTFAARHRLAEQLWDYIKERLERWGATMLPGCTVQEYNWKE